MRAKPRRPTVRWWWPCGSGWGAMKPKPSPRSERRRPSASMPEPQPGLAAVSGFGGWQGQGRGIVLRPGAQLDAHGRVGAVVAWRRDKCVRDSRNGRLRAKRSWESVQCAFRSARIMLNVFPAAIGSNPSFAPPCDGMSEKFTSSHVTPLTIQPKAMSCSKCFKLRVMGCTQRLRPSAIPASLTEDRWVVDEVSSYGVASLRVMTVGDWHSCLSLKTDWGGGSSRNTVETKIHPRTALRRRQSGYGIASSSGSGRKMRQRPPRSPAARRAGSGGPLASGFG